MNAQPNGQCVATIVSNSNPNYPRFQIHIQEVEHNKNDRKGGFALRDYSNYFLNK